MVPQIIDDMRKAYQPYEANGVFLQPEHVRVLLLMLAYLATEWRNMESRLNGSTAILLDPNSNVVPLKQPSPGSKPGGGAA